MDESALNWTPTEGHATVATHETEDALFFELPLDGGGGPHVLDVALYRDGGLVYSTTAELTDVSAGSAVELLVFHPELRAEVLALPPGSPVEFEIALDGGPAWRLSLDDVRLETEELQTWGLFPVSQVASRPQVVSVKSAGGTASLTCEDECIIYHERCEMGCGVPAAEDCLQRCDAERNQCLENCGQPPPPPPPPPTCPTVDEYQSRVTVSAVYVGPTSCRIDILDPFLGVFYDRRLATDRVSQIRETTHCNGTVTTEVLSVTYIDYLCWARTSIPCAPYNPILGLPPCFF